MKDMLDSLVRRTPKTPTPAGKFVPTQEAGKVLPDDSAKQAALLDADTFKDNESGAVDFIVKCDFADARLRAAEHVHDRHLMLKVLHASRKVDRRVAKLMQTRIDLISKQELIAKHAEDCIRDAQRMLHEIPLMSNRVADMDRAWRSIGNVIEPQLSIFEALRQEIDSRLSTQIALQRSVIDAIDALRKLNLEADTFAPEQMADMLAKIEQKVEHCRCVPEATSLPRNLLLEFEREQQRFKERQIIHQKNLTEPSTREKTLAAWEAVPPTALNSSELKRMWDKLPVSDDSSSMAALQQRFNALLKLVPQAETSSVVLTDKANAQSVFSEVLKAMELALQEGLLHIAVEQDEILRSIDLRSQQVSDSEVARLGNVRSELKRLQGWARWGGNVAREELIKSMEDLPGQKLPVQELAKKIGGSRERWKTMDSTSGAAPKVLWERFDRACTAAYAPVAEQSKRQAQERQQHKEKAQALIAEIRRFIEANGLDREDADTPVQGWKQVAHFQHSALQSWQRIGHMDRKDRKRVDAEFESVMQILTGPLRRQWQTEIERRESMIREVEQIKINDRKAIDRVRRLQEQWQEMAKALPLERKDDQALWQRFRGACNAVFAQRKETAAAADVERRKNAAAKEKLCVGLEAASLESESAIKKLLRETDVAWTRIGSVPRAREQQLNERYRKAIAAAKARLGAAQNFEKEAQYRALLEKFALCGAAESALAANLPIDPGWSAHWLMLPLLQGGRENVMRKRFDAAINAFTSGSGEYVAMLEKNRVILQQELLRVEMLAGIDSPPALAAQRMQMQVQVLQASLSGQKQEPLGVRLDCLCGLPALSDEQSVERIYHLLKRV